MAVTAREGHIFVSHSGADTEAARRLAEILHRNGLPAWFDKESLQPGDPWMPTLENAIQKASAMIVYIGRLGVRAWVDREVRLGLVRNTQEPDAFRLIPVLGEGADPSLLPPFLLQQQWVDLRDPQRAPAEIRRLVETLKNPSQERAILEDYWGGHSPFRSLQVFEPEDSWLFFGRDSETSELLTRLGRAPVLPVLGNSGSGKSSLIRAGLIPALQRGSFRSRGVGVNSWRIVVFRPSEAPFDYLAEALPAQITSQLTAKESADFIQHCRETLPLGGDALRNAIAAKAPRDAHVLLVADQFEELFTLTHNQETRHRYIDALLSSSRLGGSLSIHLIIVLRADFYAHCLEHAELSRCLEANLYNVPRMNPSQLRETIEKRLALASAHAEPGLIDSLLSDVGNEPGDLALLEHALGQLWDKRNPDGTITNSAYMEIGRLRGALGRHADEVCREIGDPTEKHLIQKVFLELVQLGEGAQDTRRRVPKEALLRLGAPTQMEQLLAQLASSRLIFTGGEGGENFVEVSHEALIREWPALRQWLAENREDLRIERRLMESAEEWQKLNRDPGALLQGARLAQAEEWLHKHAGAPALPLEFIQTSVEARAEAARKEREAQQRELARQQELVREAQARASAERSAAVRFRWFSVALAVLLLGSFAVVWFARHQQLIAESRALAAQAEQTFNQDHSAALNLAVRAWRTAGTSEAHLAVADSFPQLLATLQGHTGTVQSAVFSPDGQRILTASSDKTARLWNAANGQPLATLLGHTAPVRSAVFSPDDQRILTASEDKTARLWNAANGQLLATLQGHTGTVQSAVFSPDGQRILTASDDKTARLWNATNGELLATLQGHTGIVRTAVFSPDGQRVLTASSDSTVRVWNVAGGQPLATLQGHTLQVVSAVFSLDGQRILSASQDGTARVWNATSGQLLAILNGHNDAVWSAVFSPDGRHIVTASGDKRARVWNTADGQLLATLNGHTAAVSSAVFSPDGLHILTASDDRTAQVWNAANGQLLVILNGHTDSVRNAVFSSDGQRILTASADRTVRVWNADSGQLLATLNGHTNYVLSTVFSGDGQRILTASQDDTARMWNADSGQLLVTLQGHKGFVSSAVFSPNGQRILTASADHTARVWNADSGQLLATLQGHNDRVSGAVFSPNGQRILTASADHTARVWNADSGQLLVTLQGHNDFVSSAVFSPDGQRILTASADRTARVWNADSGQLLVTLQGHNDFVSSAVFSPDGQRVLTASADHTARVWNAANGKLLATLTGHNDRVSSAVFSPDGRRMLTASYDHTARVWNAGGQLLVKLQGHTIPVTSAVFSPDSQRILTASYTAQVFRIVTLSNIAELLAGK